MNFGRKTKVGLFGVGELKKTQAESRATSVPDQSLEGLDGGEGRKVQHSQEVWSGKHWAATPSSHRDFLAFALQRAAKIISNPLLFPGQNLFYWALWEIGADQGCPEGQRLNGRMLPTTFRNATRIQAPGSV